MIYKAPVVTMYHSFYKGLVLNRETVAELLSCILLLLQVKPNEEFHIQISPPFKDYWLLLDSLLPALYLCQPQSLQDLSTSALCQSAADLWGDCCHSVKPLLLLEERLPRDSWTISQSVKPRWPDLFHSVKPRLQLSGRNPSNSLISVLFQSAVDLWLDSSPSVRALLQGEKHQLDLSTWVAFLSAMDRWLGFSLSVKPLENDS